MGGDHCRGYSWQSVSCPPNWNIPASAAFLYLLEKFSFSDFQIQIHFAAVRSQLLAFSVFFWGFVIAGVAIPAFVEPPERGVTYISGRGTRSNLSLLKTFQKEIYLGKLDAFEELLNPSFPPSHSLR